MSVIHFRLTIEDYEKLKNDADLASISVSELVRRRYYGIPIISKTDQIVIKELRRIGGLIKYIYVDSGRQYKNEVSMVMKEIEIYIKQLIK
jgi:hypothetical protein